ncbi:hypothetical protein HAX54_030374 [Datura stramonium]|uniref:Uncharacterized protein n=1 Tax=Datura stramonium TaxID=4076 RepID=A0ABS8SAV7_DATST|nr:hypothetical protein [Datura stramonium]
MKASRDNEDRDRDNEDGEDDGDDEDRDDDDDDDDGDNNGDDDDDDDNDKTTTTNDRIEKENDVYVWSTPAETSSSGRISKTFIDTVIKNIRFDNYNLKMLIDLHGDLEGDIVVRSDHKAFNAYPWGRESFKLTLEYLLRELKANVKTINLYSFPWAFMDDDVSKEISEVVASVIAGDAIRINEDHHSYGGGYTPFGVGGAGGRYTLVGEDMQHQEDTSYMLGRSSTVATSKIEALTKAQGVTKPTINKLISKKGIYPSSRISKPFTPIGVKRRRNQNFKAMANTKKKNANTPKMMVDQPTK